MGFDHLFSAVNAQDLQGMTPLMFAASALYRGAPTLAVIKALLMAKADIGLRNESGDTALDLAVRYAEPSVIALLKNEVDR
jgi:ankyrin repeat protein